MARSSRALWLAALSALSVSAVAGLARAGPKVVGPDCTFKGHPLYGKIQVVESFPDVKVQIVDAFPDLKVRMVDASARRCGEWRLVTAFPDTKVKFVGAFGDVKIKVVEAYPGVP